MKNFLVIFIFALTFLFAAVPQVEAERITDFTASYHIGADGVVTVTELIEYDFESESRRGIFRTLFLTHPQPATAWYKDRVVKIKVESVKKNGAKEPYIVKRSATGLEIKIGDAQVYISGKHTYEIVYKIRGSLSAGPEGAELYWNVTGNDWPVSFASVKVMVTSESPEIIANKTACYVGSRGSTRRCPENRKDSSGVMFGAKGLSPRDGLTIAVEVNPDYVNALPSERISYLLLGFGFVILWLLYYGRSVYKHYTSGRVDRPIIVQYEPYDNYLPMYTGVLYDGLLGAADITAGILYLAEQGFIKIKRIETKKQVVFKSVDYEIVLLREVGEIPTIFLQKLSKLLFSKASKPGASVLLSSLENKQKKNYAVVKDLRHSISEDLRKTGIVTKTLPPWSTPKTVMAIIGTLFASSFLLIENGFVVTGIAAIGTSFISFFAINIDRRTEKGYEIKNHLEGFKQFLSVADKDRFEFHNAPEKSPELFMKYLPYAIALGVEEKWAEVFASIVLPQPDWYEGGSIGKFSAAALTSDMRSFSTSFSNNSNALKTSGTSGSSGRGSSGGGGGGGGGGSW